jgi:hypothetical protein
MYIGFYFPNEYQSNSHGVSMEFPKGSLHMCCTFIPYALPKLSSSHLYRWGGTPHFSLENNINSFGFFFFLVEPRISFCDGPIKMAH